MSVDPSGRPAAVIRLTREVLDDFVAFIRARLDEMEQRARAVEQLLEGFDRAVPPDRALLSPELEFISHHGPRQEFADVAVTRRLLEHLLFMSDLWFLPGVGRDAHAVLILASRWGWHPDYALLVRRHAQPVGEGADGR